MAEIKVSQLPEASQINDDDLIMIVQNGENKKITKENCQFASGDEIYVGDTEPTGDDAESVKLWLSEDDALEPEEGQKDYYSTSEIKTNKVWIDNKPIYRKVLTFTTNTSTGWSNQAHGITGINYVINQSMVILHSGNLYQCPNDVCIEIYTNGTNFAYYLNSATLGGKEAFAILEYTK